MDETSYYKVFFALLLILAVIGLAAIIFRRFFLDKVTGLAGVERKLKIIEVLPLDAKRRIIKISDDGREFLLLCGGSNDFVVNRYCGSGNNE